MKLKWLILGSIILGSLQGLAFECQETPEGMYVYQDEILAAGQKNLQGEEFHHVVDQPLRCLLQNYKIESGITRYVAGACLRRLFGGPEIQGFHRSRSYERVLKKLIAQQVRQQDLFKNSEVSLFAMAEWDEYQPFCQGIANENDCVNLLPNPQQIHRQTEILGASSMLVLRSAYKQFSGAAKKHVADTILKLYRETPQEQILKRKMIDQIYREMQPPMTKLNLQKS